MSSTAETLASDPRLVQALVSAERRLVMLERLAEMGMALVGEISTRAVEFPQRPGVGHEPARAFASVSRAVRLTLVLAARVEKHILAMRKVGVVLEPAMVEAEPTASLEGRRERVRSAVSVAIEREAADAEDAEGLLRRLDERLTERDDFGAFLSRPFRACVEAICEDLGLDAEAVLGEEGDETSEFILNDPSPLAGEGGPEGRMRGRRDPSANNLSGTKPIIKFGATPHPTRCAGHLLPQGEKEAPVWSPYPVALE